MEPLWSLPEKQLVASRFSAAIIGSRETVHRKLEEFLEETEVNEVMVQCEPYLQADRLRSFEIVAGVFKAIGEEADRGVGRGRGRPPHQASHESIVFKRV
jgi:hypothetical protein